MNKKYIKFNNTVVLTNGATIKLQSTKNIFNYKLNSIFYENLLDNKNNLDSSTETLKNSE